MENDEAVSETQRKTLEEMIELKILSGTKEGVSYLTRQDANKIIMDARRNEKWINWIREKRKMP